MITLRVAGFERDEGKRAKCQKSGALTAEIEALFVNDTRVAPDPKHSQDEDRMIAVGKTIGGRPLFVIFTLRTKNRR